MSSECSGAPEQTERAFQKRSCLDNKRRVTAAAVTKTQQVPRLAKDIGLGFKTPREALKGHYTDKKCPFAGGVRIRGRIFTGVIQTLKMQQTVVIRRDYLHYCRKYNRFEKRHKNMAVHMSPAFRDVSPGDVATIGECQPLSKTVTFNVVKVTKASCAKKGFKKL